MQEPSTDPLFAAYPSAAVQPEHFKDRRTGLIIFGVLSCAIGGFAALGALMTPLALVTTQMAARTPGMPPPDARSLAVAALMYVAVAVLFVWLGVDSFRVRRWVRPIVLSVGWTWLIIGVVGMAMLAFTVPHLVEAIDASSVAQGGAALPREFRVVMVIFMIAFSALLYLVLPGAYLWFYSRRNVKATLEYYDPEPSWTDRVPVQVLGLSVGLVLGAVSVLITLPYAVLPIAGTILTGIPAVLSLLGIAALFGRMAVLTYQRRMLGWWLTTIFTIVLPIACMISFRRYTLTDIYREAGFPPETIEMMSAYSSAGTMPSIIAMSVLTVACLAYMAYVLKYFRAPRGTEGTMQPAMPMSGN